MALSYATLPLNQFRFVELGQLGVGGLGRVDRISITESNCATKAVGSEWARKRLNSKWDAHPEMVVRFEREISALKRMHHANIVTLEGENLPGAARFYLMPLFSSSVRKLIAVGGWTGDWANVARCGINLANAMQYAHDAGFIHRDLKPDNILFNGGGPLVIADWGLGYFVHKESKVLQQLTRGGMGTEYYCSLEQWSSGKCDHRGDIYSLGMTLDEWVRGRQMAITIGMGVAGASVNSSSAGAVAFNQVVRRMTMPLASQRLPTMVAVAQQFAAALRLDGLR